MIPALRDSRRLPGVNLLYDGPGAVIDVAFSDADGDALVRRWQRHLARARSALAWPPAEVRVRRFPGGASLFFSAPIDALYAATEVNEWAWHAAAAESAGQSLSLDDALPDLRGFIERERAPALAALQAEAARRGVSFHVDHKGVSVGSGTGSKTWPAADPKRPVAPPPDRVPWSQVRDVPTVLVTGSNGKTTTVRLLASIVRAWGRLPGYCSTDHIVIGHEVADAGDWSGPMGARWVLRDPRVEVAILETARGGILRRGLATAAADAAIVTNVAEDHFGEWGITDLSGIAATKLVVGHVARRLAINAEDPVLVDQLKAQRAEGRIKADIGYFALDPANPLVAARRTANGTVAFLDHGRLVFARGKKQVDVCAAADVPITLGGLARYNIANALGAILLASAIGVPRDAIALGLRTFRGTPRENPGRSHLYDFGAKVIVDFAHNPHGQSALIETAQAMPARRRAIVLGQAGDRDDASIRALARATWPWRPDLVVLKEMEKYLRGRQKGEATTLIRDELVALGAGETIFAHADTELEAVRAALAWARPGDLVLLPTHAQRDEVLALMERLEQSRWTAGEVLP